MNTQTQEALHKALKVLNCLNNDRVYETAWVKGAINACEEALAQPAQSITEGSTMFKRVGNSPKPPPPPPIHICTYSRTMNQEYPRKCVHCGKVEALEQPITRDWKETIDERIARDSKFKEALEQKENKNGNS